MPAGEKARPAQFAETATFRHGICVYAQVGKQGPDEASRRLADVPAEQVRRFLIGRGVPAKATRIGAQVEAFALFGLLPSNQDDDRRVFVTHN